MYADVPMYSSTMPATGICLTGLRPSSTSTVTEIAAPHAQDLGQLERQHQPVGRQSQGPGLDVDHPVQLGVGHEAADRDDPRSLGARSRAGTARIGSA